MNIISRLTSAIKTSPTFSICSDCFRDTGLQLSAGTFGADNTRRCKHCGSTTGRKLDKNDLFRLCRQFFVDGTIQHYLYGAAPTFQIKEGEGDNLPLPHWLVHDLDLLVSKIDLGVVYYGPRTWMVGEIEPLKDLQRPETMMPVINRILAQYPTQEVTPNDHFYRIRMNIETPYKASQFDAPPPEFAGNGRLDTKILPTMYCSQDLQICLHECRVAAADEIFVATLQTRRNFRLLDLTAVLDEGVTEFESLDMTVHMLFLAESHSYPISRAIAAAAHAAGFDGLIYPSYFSLLRTGHRPYKTSYGISHRIVPHLAKSERAKIVPNLALFGRPIAEGSVFVTSINKVILSKIDYQMFFGPVLADEQL